MYLDEKEIRIKTGFNTNWFFCHVESEQPVVGDRDCSGFRAVTLPHDWSMDYPFAFDAPGGGSGGYAVTGTGWYRKVFIAEKPTDGSRVFLLFDGAYMNTDVWINGRHLGRHVYGYTPFTYEVTDWLRDTAGPENVLDVRVDNSAQPNSRWYSGSGITRNVWIVRVPAVRIAENGVFIRTLSADASHALLAAEVQLENAQEGMVVHVRVEKYGTEKGVCAETVCRLQDESGKVQVQLQMNRPELWTTEQPFLYEVTVELLEPSDRLSERPGEAVSVLDRYTLRTGIRTAVFDPDRGFLLNGERVKINGVCIHHDGGCVGAAVPIQIWRRRLMKLKIMGVNGIRMSHNPPDPELLDLCDELGFLVMDEAFDEWKIMKAKELGSNTHESRGYSEWFELYHEDDLRAMLLRDRNHPCIVIWSIGNEVPDQTAKNGWQTAKRLKAICKELDPDRAVTQANDQIAAEPEAARAEFLEELDVVGYNYTGRWRTRAETLYDDDKRTHPDWCIIGTENSGMGGVRGQYSLRRPEGDWWGREPYYAAPVQVGKLLRYTMTHDYVAGDFMWTGIDYLGEAHRPNRLAAAGVLDTCGFEKGSYYFYKSIWNRKEPLVHLEPHWNMAVEEGTILPVLGFTNCQAAELLLNGRSYGTKAYAYPMYGMTEKYGHFESQPGVYNTDDLFLSWDVPYEPGRIELVGYNDGAEVCRHTVWTAGAPAALEAVMYSPTAKADGNDVIQVEIMVTDRHGNLCPDAACNVWIVVEGPAEILGVDSGRPDSMECCRTDGITTFNGRALVILRSNGVTGSCTIRFGSEELCGSEVKAEFL